MTDDETEARITELAVKAMTDAKGDPALAAVMLLDAACCVMITYMPPGAATKLAPTYGSYMAEKIGMALGVGEVRQ